MERLTTRRGVTVSYERTGDGPPLVLVHGAFSDHDTNWTFVKPRLAEAFTVYAVARRGRGETDATRNHELTDEAEDVVSVLERIEEPVFLLGHSYGAHCALLATHRAPARVLKLVLYEPAWPSLMTPEALAPLERLAADGDWEAFASSFFHLALHVPTVELDALRATDLWPPILADAEASLGDLRALQRYDFDARRFRDLTLPVLLQVGTESPRDLYATDALAAVLPDARIEELAGQAHEGMTTAPDQYVESVMRFLRDGS
jgi:pimeloyl-ACP methyl ester carboxylesterase